MYVIYIYYGDVYIYINAACICIYIYIHMYIYIYIYIISDHISINYAIMVVFFPYDFGS